MTVLITGGTGFIGSHVARHLLQANQSVRLLVRDIEKAKAVFSRIDLSFDSQPVSYTHLTLPTSDLV